MAALLAVPSPAAAQGGGRALTVRGTQGLTFGSVIPGVPMTVPYTDLARAALFEVRGPTDAQIELTFTLPVALAGPAGAQLPLGFTATSAALSLNGNAASATPRDPRTRFTAVLDPRNGRIYLHLGGRALPAGTQRAGAYAGTVLLTAAFTGI